MIDTIGFALGAGLVAALNPCGFAFLPGYLGLVIAGDSMDSSRSMALARAGAATIAMSAGFITVFGIFGLLISPLIASAQKYLPFATVLIGVVLVGLGAWLIAGKDVTVIMPKLSRGAPTAQLRSMFGYGVGYAIASLSCTIGPFLAMISLTFKQGSILTGVLAFVAYASGMTVTVGVAALTVALAGSTSAGALRRILPQVGRIAGVVVLLTGLYVTYYGYYEIRLYFAGGSPDDPIIEGAATVQGWLSRQVETLGFWPMLAALVALAAIGLIWRLIARRRAYRG
ncbi:cytochrome c biogenesis CcdA family protein [Mycobacterium sp.]|uniref:cytochrome c biogenesis CcdA family protein n=1 Tax=Mycobacterium sp. TaxID=1785 RepID=UPI003BADA040